MSIYCSDCLQKLKTCRRKKVPEKPSFKTNSDQSGLDSRVIFFLGGGRGVQLHGNREEVSEKVVLREGWSF